MGVFAGAGKRAELIGGGGVLDRHTVLQEGCGKREQDCEIYR